MSNRRARQILGTVLALGVACSAQPAEDRISIRDASVAIEVVETPADQQRGLGGRDHLRWNSGMLFVYPAPSHVTMWMKNMRFDIDIVWIRENRIVDMAWRARHAVPEPLPIYQPREPADSVLEVPAGYAEAHGWRIGDRVRLERAASTP